MVVNTIFFPPIYPGLKCPSSFGNSFVCSCPCKSACIRQESRQGFGWNRRQRRNSLCSCLICAKFSKKLSAFILEILSACTLSFPAMCWAFMPNVLVINNLQNIRAKAFPILFDSTAFFVHDTADVLSESTCKSGCSISIFWSRMA